jgi:hypothetical protein
VGKQVNFFATELDLSSIEQHLRTNAPYVALHSRAETSRPRILSHLSYEQHGKAWPFFFLVQEENLRDVRMRHVPAQDYWTIDVLTSPVVEFLKGLQGESGLQPSRLYFTASYFAPDGALVAKPDTCRDWAASVFSTSKKLMKKRGAYYIAPDAGRLEASGVALMQ